jgi:ATP-dependent DNA helicase RecG
LHQRFGADFDALSGDEIQALVTAHTEGAVTNQQLQGMLAMHRADITRMLGGLVTRGFLVSDGIGRGTRYSLAGAALPEGTPPLGRGTPP